MGIYHKLHWGFAAPPRHNITKYTRWCLTDDAHSAKLAP
jgi:hypothetical protein